MWILEILIKKCLFGSVATKCKFSNVDNYVSSTEKFKTCDKFINRENSLHFDKLQ